MFHSLRYSFAFLVAVVLSLSALSTPAQAVPVRFTYEAQRVQAPVYDAEWKQIWFDTYAGFYKQTVLRMADFQAGITLEVECDVTGGVWDCASLEKPAMYASGVHDISDDNVIAPGIRHVSMDGLWMNYSATRFRVGSAGRVVEWSFSGFEQYYGEFWFFDTGDRFMYTDAILDQALVYCQVTFGVMAIDYRTCANGEIAPIFETSLDLGIGTWTNDYVDPPGVPLPAGLPLLLTALGLPLVLRRRVSR